MKSILAACAILVMAVVGVAAEDCSDHFTQANCNAAKDDWGLQCAWDSASNPPACSGLRPPTPAPTSAASYCAVQASCGDCVDAQMQSCAWCGSTGRCVVADFSNGPPGSCAGNCPNCQSSQSQCKAADTCKAQSSSCSACVANSQVVGAASCGWCPSTSTCSSDWLSLTCGSSSGSGAESWHITYCPAPPTPAGSSAPPTPAGDESSLFGDCAVHASCGDCVKAHGCGWCSSSKTCQNWIVSSCSISDWFVIQSECPTAMTIGYILLIVGGILICVCIAGCIFCCFRRSKTVIVQQAVGGQPVMQPAAQQMDMTQPMQDMGQVQQGHYAAMPNQTC